MPDIEFPQAALHDNRFRIPFSDDREFVPLKTQEGDFDLSALKRDAENYAQKKGDQFARNVGNSKDIPNAVLGLLTLGHYRKGQIGFVDAGKDDFTQKIMSALSEGKPLVLTYSFFPFKVLNPLKTFAIDGSEVDIGEVSAVLRLYEIVLALSHVYPYGVKFVITADGVKYHDVFGIPEWSSFVYSYRVREIIRYLGLENFIEIVEETDLYPENYPELREDAISDVEAKYRAGDVETVALVTRLYCNIALILSTSYVPVQILALVFNQSISDDALKAMNRDAYFLRQDIRKSALDSTFRYIGTYKVPYLCGMTETHFPGALKCTVHPKPGQIGIYSVNEATPLFPHHGQGHISFNRSGDPRLEDTRVGFAADIMRTVADRSTGITLSPAKYPFSNGVHPFTISQNR